MLKKVFFLLLALALSASLVLANAPLKGSLKGKPMTPAKAIGPHDVFTNPGSFPPTRSPLNTDDPIGDIFVLGYTWYDIQHNASCGRQIQIDNEGWVQVAWMNGEEAMAINRHIYHQLVDSSDSVIFVPPNYPTYGVMVDVMPRAGYVTLAVHSDCRAVLTFHQGAGGSYNLNSVIAYAMLPHREVFIIENLPEIYGLELIWPKIAADRNDRFHIITTANTPAPLAPHGQYYISAEIDVINYQVTFYPDSQQFTGYTEVISAEVAASPVSDRVAVAWMDFCATNPDTSQYDNNLIICISEDGETWDWSDTINITNWIPPDISILPGTLATAIDTLLANRDTLRCYADVSLYFDYDDVLHAAFSTRGLYSLEGILTWGNGFVVHWDEMNRELSVLANGWYANGGGYFDPGAWNIFCQRPSLAQDPATDYLYCIYQRYIEPVDTFLQFFPDFYLWADSSDISAGGYPNGEVWMTVSTDGGLTWAAGTNITDTQTPGAPPGECMSEVSPSMALDIVDGYGRVFYVIDKDAGAVVQNEGEWTENDVIYQKVPVSEIATEPVIQEMYDDLPPIHIDTTMYAPTILSYSPIELTINTSPGAQLDFDIEASDPGGPVTYEWIQEILDNGNNIIDRITVGTDSSLTWTAPAEEGFYRLKGRAYGVSYFNEKVWFIESTQVGVHDTPVAVVPGEYSLSRNYPNPFNPETHLTLALPKAGDVSLIVYDVTGREVIRLVDGWLNAGYEDVVFDGSQLSSGVYFARLKAGEFSQTQKLLLVK